MSAEIQQLTSVLSQASLAQQIDMAVLKKALDAQKMVAAGLLQALPPVPELATEGSVGTRVNTYA
ncbi:MAG TPA: YjfB family protein [Steroidobacteraceae bacterium]|nr:YjfB family protein [Steroidobacteraceae bacterium]